MNPSTPFFRFAAQVVAAAASTIALTAASQTIDHQIVVFTGDNAPGVPSGNFSKIEHASASRDGRVAFQAVVTGPGVTNANNVGVWTAPSSFVPNRLVARKGGAAPWGTVYQTFASPRIGSGGHVAFIMDNGGSVEGSLFGIVGLPDSLGSLLFNGMAAPSKPSRKFLIFHVETVNSSGVSVAEALLDDSSRGIWHGVPGNLQKLAAAGDAAPGLGTTGTTFTKANLSSINENGTVAFYGTLSGDQAFSESIWRGTPGALVPIIRSGSTLANGEIVKSLDAPVINNANVIAFRGATTTVSDGVWTHSASGFQRHLASGQVAPVPVGNRSFSSFKTIALNNSGQIAFDATLSGDSTTAQSLWRRDPDGTLTLIVQAGMLLPVRGGTTAALSQFFIDKHCLADNGDVFFLARFGTGNDAIWGVYRSRAVTAAKTAKAPAVKLRGGSVFRTSSSRVLLRGTTLAGSAPVRRVEVRHEKSKQFGKASGVSKWTARPKVPVGRSKVLVRARAADGLLSKTVAARVVRRK